LGGGRQKEAGLPALCCLSWAKWRAPPHFFKTFALCPLVYVRINAEFACFGLISMLDNASCFNDNGSMKERETMTTKQKPSQGLFPGFLTEGDIIREHYRRIGRKGGKVTGGKKSAAARRNILAYHAKRWEQSQNAKQC
jgi:general stress protein YciG